MRRSARSAPAPARWSLDPRSPRLRADIEGILLDQCRVLAAWALSEKSLGLRIHRVRRASKRLRALGRLLRTALGERAYRRFNLAMRDLARRAAASRDADVLLATCEALAPLRGNGAERIDALARERFARLAERERDRLESHRVLPGIARAIGVIAVEWPKALPRAVASGDLRRGVEASYRRARLQAEAARREPTIPQLHELRKRVKVVHAHVQLLAPATAAWRRDTKNLDRLGRRLGDDHDWAMLIARLEKGRLGSARAVAKARRKRERIQGEALDLMRKCFRASPAAFARRLVQ